MGRVTLFQSHCERWGNGCGTNECETATSRVLYRGQIPCDVLFIGEAPGESEDSLAAPFKGPSGKLLDRIVEKALPEEVRRGFTNIVGCLPRLEDGSKDRKPKDEQVKACEPRLVEIVRIACPKLIIAVGGFARDWLDEKRHHSIKLPTLCPDCGTYQTLNETGYGCINGHKYGRKQRGVRIPRVDIIHPAHIKRQSEAQQDLSEQKCVVQIIQAMEEFLTKPDELDRWVEEQNNFPF